MKRILMMIAVFSFVLLSTFDVSAQNIEGTNAYGYSDDLAESLELEKLYSSLSPQARESLERMGIGVGVDLLSDVSFTSVINEIFSIMTTQGVGVLKSAGLVICVLLLYSLTESFSQSLTSGTIQDVMSIISALCIAGALVIPVTDVIDTASSAIITASDFMLMFVPIMVAVLVSCGKTLSGAGYYSLMVFAAEGISQLSAKFITPMLNVFLGVSICSTIVPQVKLESITDLFAKTIKWLLSFSFTIFSALLTFKTLISTSIDSVSSRAVRFTMSSFIPVVGAALSEAYKTVQGSVNILKNGMGVFVIFAVAVVFLPVLTRLLLWNFSLNMSKTLSQILSLSVPFRMISGVSTVLSVLLAVLLCIMALFIISTALIITAGGYSQ